jgi:pyruvate-ferredoxin/flavodoxin oxidoreductase
MGKSITEEELAVKAGYWANYRYNPQLKAEGKDAFILDSKAPTGSYEEFIMGEVRYSSLKRANPERAAKLFAKSEAEAKERYENLVKLVDFHKA